MLTSKNLPQNYVKTLQIPTKTSREISQTYPQNLTKTSQESAKNTTNKYAYEPLEEPPSGLVLEMYWKRLMNTHKKLEVQARESHRYLQNQ